MFNQEELQTIISGVPGGLDVDDMEQNAVYSGGFHKNHPAIQSFWRVLRSFQPEDQKKFLMFATSCSRVKKRIFRILSWRINFVQPPLLGFKYLEPKLAIHMARSSEGDVQDYLPTASTCMNFFKLPPYDSDQKMREKILYAIRAQAGFELS